MLILIIEIDKIFKFEILNLLYGCFDFKSKFQKFAYVIMLSLLTKLSDLGTSWVFGSKLKGYHPQLDPPNPPPRSSQKLLYHIQTNTIC
jgi:hypothetical protein